MSQPSVRSEYSDATGLAPQTGRQKLRHKRYNAAPENTRSKAVPRTLDERIGGAAEESETETARLREENIRQRVAAKMSELEVERRGEIEATQNASAHRSLAREIGVASREIAVISPFGEANALTLAGTISHSVDESRGHLPSPHHAHVGPTHAQLPSTAHACQTHSCR
jgi:hypothetical protein